VATLTIQLSGARHYAQRVRAAYKFASPSLACLARSALGARCMRRARRPSRNARPRGLNWGAPRWTASGDRCSRAQPVIRTPHQALTPSTASCLRSPAVNRSLSAVNRRSVSPGPLSLRSAPWREDRCPQASISRSPWLSGSRRRARRDRPARPQRRAMAKEKARPRSTRIERGRVNQTGHVLAPRKYGSVLAAPGQGVFGEPWCGATGGSGGDGAGSPGVQRGRRGFESRRV